MSSGLSDFEHKADIFIQNLIAIGDIQDACIVSDIAETTLAGWRRRSPKFDARVRDAFQQFRDTLPVVLKNEAKKQLANAVFGRNKITATKITSNYDKDGNLIGRTEVTEEMYQLPQRWAIERILDADQTTEIERALQVLANAGYLPKTLTQRAIAILDNKDDQVKALFTEYYPDSTVEQKRGISEETVNTIIHQILGSGDSPELATIEVEATNEIEEHSTEESKEI